jgi:hypothetical protein
MARAPLSRDGPGRSIRISTQPSARERHAVAHVRRPAPARRGAFRGAGGRRTLEAASAAAGE